jgi:S-formylglutathione hydrolase FrmB
MIGRQVTHGRAEATAGSKRAAIGHSMDATAAAHELS